MNICYRGAVYNCSGYAQIRHLFLQLHKRKHNVRIEPFNSKDNVKILYENEFIKLENTKLKKPYINIISGIAPQLTIDTEASYNIAHSMFETTELPEKWVQLYNQFDEIWTPSNFCFNSFNRKDLSCRIQIIPFGVDSSLYKNIQKKQNQMFTFLSIGQWIDRKGWDLLIQAYTAEFMGQHDVRLCIKTFNDQKSNEEMIKEYLCKCKNSSYMPRIMIKNQKVDESVLPVFYQEADCFILPSRGEAFGLPFLESMASSVPVITTNFGGQIDFVDQTNGWLIEIKQLKHLSERLCKINSAFSNLWFAEPQIDDIRNIMRYVFEHRDEVSQKGKISREFVLNNYTWEKITDIAEAKLLEVFEKL